MPEFANQAGKLAAILVALSALAASHSPASAASITNCDTVTRHSKLIRVNAFDLQLKHQPNSRTELSINNGASHVMTHSDYGPVGPVQTLYSQASYVIRNGQLMQGNGCQVYPPYPGPIDGGGGHGKGCLYIGLVQICFGR